MKLKGFIRNMVMLWMLLMGTIAALHANDDFSPTNPPEPNANFKVTVSSSQGYTSGSGLYQQGTQVYISTSSYNENYSFAYWTLDGEKYSEESSFYYTIADRSVSFVAVYEYTPVNPSEPQATNAYRLYLKSDTPGCCSFNLSSGTKVEAGSSVYIYAYVNQGYDFKGWYKGNEKVSDYLYFDYIMPAENTTLTAKFEYNPSSPSEPESALPVFYGQNLTLSASEANSYYGTFSSNSVTFFPQTTEVKAVAAFEGKLALLDLKKATATINSEDVTGYFVPANTGVLVKSAQADVAYYTVEKQKVDSLTFNGLVAATEWGTFTAEDGYKYYKLAYGDNTANTSLGFHYGAEDGGAFYMNAGEAYLKVAAATSQDYAFANDTVHLYRGNLYNTEGEAQAQTTILDLHAEHIGMVNASDSAKYSVYALQPNEFIVLDKTQEELGDSISSMGENLVSKDGYANRVKFSDQASYSMPACFGDDGDIQAAAVEYTRSVTNKWGTLCLPFAIHTDNNTTCKFYAVTNIGSESLVAERLTGIIPAGTPVLVYCAGNGSFEVSAENATLVAQPVSDTYMTGTFGEISVGVNQGNYIISNNRFWSVDGLVSGNASAAVKLKGFRSYIAQPTAKARVLRIVVDSTDDIDVVNSLNSADTEYYDIEGRKVDTPQRGVAILKNGNEVKKVIIK